MTRQEKHQESRDLIADRLRHNGHSVVKAATREYDLLVDGVVRVALRVAYPGRYAHTVTVNGRRYAYDYRSWNFNFHRHGRWGEKYCDVFICIAKHRRAADEIFVVPAPAVTGPTLTLHGAKKPYRGHYAKYRNGWHVIPRLVRRREWLAA